MVNSHSSLNKVSEKSLTWLILLGVVAKKFEDLALIDGLSVLFVERLLDLWWQL